MSYHQAFDRIGNQVKPAKPDWQYRLIQRAALVTIVACIAILLWGR